MVEEAWVRVSVIHLQQTDGKGDGHWPFTERCNEVGVVTPARVIDAIEDSGARELCLFLEIVHPFEAQERQVLADLRASVEYWKEAL